MTAVTVVSKGNMGLTPERGLQIDNITVTSDFTYTPSNPTGGSLKIAFCYNQTDGAIVKATESSGVITLGNGQSLSGEDVTIGYYFV